MMGVSAKNVLPTSETAPFTQAATAGFGGALDDGLKSALSIPTAPEHLLPHLAVHEGVALWYDDWSIARKRLAISTSLVTRSLIGMLPALRRFLALVDATLVDREAYPKKFIFNRSRVGVDPIGLKPHRGRYLIKTDISPAPNAVRVGVSPMGRRTFLSVPDREPLRRATAATVASKVPQTQYLTDFAHRRRVRFSDLETFNHWPSFARTFVDRTLLRQPT